MTSTVPTPVLVTGAAGFIGAATSARLLADGVKVVGVDNLNSYYDPQLKKDRLKPLLENPGFTFVEGDIATEGFVEGLFQQHGFARAVHLAAQAGVRYSLENPDAYVQTNLVGHMRVLEACRHQAARRAGFRHLVYASSSSVYGGNTKVPFAETDAVEHPVSLYAATKRSNELLSESYSHLYNIPMSGLRFFTVYGPWGRPDMAPMLFTRAILAGETIKVFNNGDMLRDFTYIDDIVEGVVRLLARPPQKTALNSISHTRPAHEVYNIGNNQPVKLMDFISTLEQAIGCEAAKTYLPMQPGDVPATYADTQKIQQAADFAPSTPLREGLQKTVSWYRQYFGIEGLPKGATSLRETA